MHGTAVWMNELAQRSAKIKLMKMKKARQL